VEPVAAKSARRPGQRAYLLIVLFALALVILPFLFWYQTWFGRRLTAAEIEQCLNDPAKPRRSQHALVQIGERMSRGDRSLERWYPRIVALADNPSPELRQTVAWIMGQDSRHSEFHRALRRLIEDSEPMVRRNAALALANFRDESARAELRAMLQPSTIVSPAAGAVKYRLKVDQFVNPGTLVARIGDAEVRAKLPGKVTALLRPDGAQLAAGDPLVELSTDNEHAWEALRALYLIGGREELEPVRRYARGWPGMPERLQEQANHTLRAIEARGQ